MKLEDIDRNFKTPSGAQFELEWHPPVAPMSLEGFPWFAQEQVYCRLPQAALPSMNEGVRGLAWHTAGGALRFVTDSPYLVLRVSLRALPGMCHMPDTGSSGFDLYVGPSRARRYIKTAIPARSADLYTALVSDQLGTGLKECLVNFPLYNGVVELALGLKPGSRVEAPPPYAIDRPILFYGSSITQGGCASRPGNAYTHHVARRLDAPLINFGFSGSARGEPALAELCASLELSALVLDYDHNAPTLEHLRATHGPFFRILRERHPSLPVVFVTRPDFFSGSTECLKRRDIVRWTYDQAKQAGDRHVFFVDGELLFGTTDRDACTVDGCHPNDLGFLRMADAITPAVAQALGLAP